MALRGLFRLLGAIAAVASLTAPVLAQGMIKSAIDDQCASNNARLTELRDELTELEKTAPAIPADQQQKARDVLELLNVPLAMSDFMVTADFQTEMAAAAAIFGYDWKACAFKDLRACTLGFQSKLREQFAAVEDLTFKIDTHKAQIHRIETNLVVLGCVPSVVSPVGHWKTKFGIVEITGEHDFVGTYGAGGKLAGSMQDRTLTGYWWSPKVATAVKCKSEHELTHYYGTFKFTFDLDGKAFKGTSWNCDVSSGEVEWNGTYIGP